MPTATTAVVLCVLLCVAVVQVDAFGGVKYKKYVTCANDNDCCYDHTDVACNRGRSATDTVGRPFCASPGTVPPNRPTAAATARVNSTNIITGICVACRTDCDCGANQFCNKPMLGSTGPTLDEFDAGHLRGLWGTCAQMSSAFSAAQLGSTGINTMGGDCSVDGSETLDSTSDKLWCGVAWKANNSNTYYKMFEGKCVARKCVMCDSTSPTCEGGVERVCVSNAFMEKGTSWSPAQFMHGTNAPLNIMLLMLSLLVVLVIGRQLFSWNRRRLNKHQTVAEDEEEVAL